MNLWYKSKHLYAHNQFQIQLRSIRNGVQPEVFSFGTLCIILVLIDFLLNLFTKQCDLLITYVCLLDDSLGQPQILINPCKGILDGSTLLLPGGMSREMVEHAPCLVVVPGLCVTCGWHTCI